MNVRAWIIGTLTLPLSIIATVLGFYSGGVLLSAVLFVLVVMAGFMLSKPWEWP